MKVGTDGVLLGAWADPGDASLIVDAGAGSGLLALMMAQRTSPEVRVIAIEISPEAAADADDNVMTSPWRDRIEVVRADCLTFPLPADRKVMLISNPPFFSEPLRSPEAGRALARHGEEFVVMSLIDFAATHHDPVLAFIAPTQRDDEVEFRLALRRLTPNRICHVVTREGREPLRTLWQASRRGPVRRESLTVRDSGNRYTPEYLSLTSEFYLDR